MVNNYTHSVNYHAKSTFEIARIIRSIYMLFDIKALSFQFFNIDVNLYNILYYFIYLYNIINIRCRNDYDQYKLKQM